MIEFVVLSCLVAAGDPAVGTVHPADSVDPAGAVDPAGLGGRPVHRTGPRPGKEIDPLLTGRVLVVGDDADLAAVALRLVRRSLLTEVDLAYAPAGPTPLTRLWGLPTGADAVRAAGSADAHPVPLVRDDVGGVLVAEGSVSPLLGATYVDEHKVLAGAALSLVVRPDRAAGLTVTVVRRGAVPWTRRSTTTPGRAVQIGSAVPATVISDGVRYARPMDRWTFYRHTQDLRLVAGVPGS